MRAQTGASMTTEYQDRFLPPRYHKAVVSTATQRGHYHPLKGTSNDASAYRLFYVTHKRMKRPRKAPQLEAPQAPTAPGAPRRRGSAPHAPAASAANTSPLEAYTSVYKNDFREWGTNRHRRFQRDPAPADVSPRDVPRPPFEGISCYRSHYVAHTLPPRAQELGRRTSTGLPLGPAPPVTKNPESSDGADELCKRFHTWSLKTSPGQAQACAEGADVTFLSTTHAHYTAHRCQHGRPSLPPVNTGGKTTEPFQAMTTTREDYRAWDAPSRTQEAEQKERVPSGCGPAPAQSSGACKLRLESATPTNRPERTPTLPAPRGNEESRTRWSTCLVRGVTRSERGDCKEPSRAQRVVGCMVSSGR